MTRFIDAEKRVIDFLAEQTGLPVGTKIPAGKVSKFIRLEQTGGTRLMKVVDGPVVSVECYAATDVEARELMDDVRELLSLMHLGDQTPGRVYRVVEVGGIVNLPDPRHTSHRYSMPFSVHTRGKRSTRRLK